MRGKIYGEKRMKSFLSFSSDDEIHIFFVILYYYIIIIFDHPPPAAVIQPLPHHSPHCPLHFHAACPIFIFFSSRHIITSSFIFLSLFVFSAFLLDTLFIAPPLLYYALFFCLLFIRPALCQRYIFMPCCHYYDAMLLCWRNAFRYAIFLRAPFSFSSFSRYATYINAIFIIIHESRCHFHYAAAAMTPDYPSPRFRLFKMHDFRYAIFSLYDETFRGAAAMLPL